MAILNCQEIWGTFPDFRGWLMANPLRILTPGSKSLYANTGRRADSKDMDLG
ncbi:MAG: hypothetical protein MHM6MM_000860 [Cercozoa sp. M6MM]